jgi:hypothetical protein
MSVLTYLETLHESNTTRWAVSMGLPELGRIRFSARFYIVRDSAIHADHDNGSHTGRFHIGLGYGDFSGSHYKILSKKGRPAGSLALADLRKLNDLESNKNLVHIRDQVLFLRVNNLFVDDPKETLSVRIIDNDFKTGMREPDSP